MPSHRSPSFSRLKDVLTQMPPRTPESEPQEAYSATQADTQPQEKTNNLRIYATSQPASRNTAAVQQNAPASPSSPSTLAARPGKAKAITRPSTFRLAVELQDALKTVAEYNSLNMTDIVAESIWLHIQNFEWPPDSETLRQRVSQLF